MLCYAAHRKQKAHRKQSSGTLLKSKILNACLCKAQDQGLRPLMVTRRVTIMVSRRKIIKRYAVKIEDFKCMVVALGACMVPFRRLLCASKNAHKRDKKKAENKTALLKYPILTAEGWLVEQYASYPMLLKSTILTTRLR